MGELDTSQRQAIKGYFTNVEQTDVVIAVGALYQPLEVLLWVRISFGSHHKEPETATLVNIFL